MEQIILRKDSDNSQTTISNRFIDDYMPSANGEYVKIYLYLVRCLSDKEMQFNLSAIEDIFECTNKDVLRALKYWERVGLMALTFDKNKALSEITLLDFPAKYPEEEYSNTSSAKETAVLPDAEAGAGAEVNAGVVTNPGAAGCNVVTSFAKNPVPVMRQYTMEESDAFQEKVADHDLMFSTETYFGRPLTQTEINHFIYWYEDLHFEEDLIEYLVEVSIASNHKSIHYMNAIAISWAEKGIHSVAEAKKEVDSNNRMVREVQRAFGISGRTLVEMEINLILKWAEEYRFNLDLIKEACTRTILNTNQANFKYADSILSRWHEVGVKTMADVKQDDLARQAQYSTPKVSKKPTTKQSQPKNQFNSFNQRTYDYEMLERQLLLNRKDS